MQVHARLLHAAYEQLFHAHFPRNLLERFFGVADGERHQDGARPRGNLVDVEPEPVRKKHDLGGNRGNGVVVVLAEKAQIDFGEGVNFGNAAELEDLLACFVQRGVIGGIARQLQTEISFD